MFKRIITAAAAVLIICGAPALGATVSVSVKNASGKPVRDAVVFLTPATGKAPAAKDGASAVMDQINMQFSPHVLAVQIGTNVKFPNSDNVLHHVYSFSPAKRFELPLYKGKPASPVTFDKPGIVALGCNIHDWMSGFIIVVDTPYYAKTGADGKAEISGVPAGNYTAKAWGENMKQSVDGTAKKVTAGQSGGNTVEFSLDIKTPKKAASSGGAGGIGQY